MFVADLKKSLIYTKAWSLEIKIRKKGFTTYLTDSAICRADFVLFSISLSTNEVKSKSVHKSPHSDISNVRDTSSLESI